MGSKKNKKNLGKTKKKIRTILGEQEECKHVGKKNGNVGKKKRTSGLKGLSHETDFNNVDEN